LLRLGWTLWLIMCCSLHKLLLCKGVKSWMGWLSFIKQFVNCIKNMNGVILKIDFKNAYDKVKSSFLQQTLKMKGFFMNGACFDP
jgi:hypothetical protein